MIWLQQPSFIAPSSLLGRSYFLLPFSPGGILTRHLAGGIKIILLLFGDYSLIPPPTNKNNNINCFIFSSRWKQSSMMLHGWLHVANLHIITSTPRSLMEQES
jgi:hypothetical protein